VFFQVVDSDVDLRTDLDRAFPAFVRRHQDAVFSVALGMTGSRHDAEEAAQEAFARAYRALAGYDAGRRAALLERPWLATITLNVCRNLARQRARRLATLPLHTLDGQDGAGPLVDDRPGPDEVASRDWWADQVRRLPERYRAALVLRHVHGLSYDEAAEALGRPAGTVKAQVHRAVALLRAAVERAAGEEDEA